jgi:hypothetical protein
MLATHRERWSNSSLSPSRAAHHSLLPNSDMALLRRALLAAAVMSPSQPGRPRHGRFAAAIHNRGPIASS